MQRIFCHPRCVLALFCGLTAITLHAGGLATPFEPPPERDAPSSTAGGGSRPGQPSCGTGQSAQAIALAPQTFVGLSSEAQPNFWIYLPNLDVDQVELSLFDAELKGLVQTTFTLPSQSGFVPLQLPESYELDRDQTYYWSAALICNPQRRSEDWVIGGWIRYQPTATSQATRLQTLSPLQQVNYQLHQGYWYDAVTTLLPLTRTLPPDPHLQPIWIALLQQADLAPPWKTLDDSARLSQR